MIKKRKNYNNYFIRLFFWLKLYFKPQNNNGVKWLLETGYINY